MSRAETKWTLVQHSGYGYRGKEELVKGLEPRQVTTWAEQRMIQKLGGMLFHAREAAEEFAEHEMYPDSQYGGLIPMVPGSFAEKGIDGLAIYLPARHG